MRFRYSLPFAALAMLGLAPAAAQRRQPHPEQRIERLEKQVRQVQKQVFPKGQPADTAGFSDDPAATQESVNNLGGRLDAIERQMAGHPPPVGREWQSRRRDGSRAGPLRADQDRRLRALESGGAARPVPRQAPAGRGERAGRSAAARSTARRSKPRCAPNSTRRRSRRPSTPAEAAYDEGYQLWNGGKYDAAIKSLRPWPRHTPTIAASAGPTTSPGRAMLDKGQPRAAAEALLANYRATPRASARQDSLFYLGQA